MRSIIRTVKRVIRANQGVCSWERAVWPWRTPQTPLVFSCGGDRDWGWGWGFGGLAWGSC